MIHKFQLEQRTILRSANRIIAPAKVFEIIGIACTEIWLIYRLLYRHNLSISSYIFYSGIIARINTALNMVVTSYASMQESLLYARDYYAFRSYSRRSRIVHTRSGWTGTSYPVSSLSTSGFSIPEQRTPFSTT